MMRKIMVYTGTSIGLEKDIQLSGVTKGGLLSLLSPKVFLKSTVCQELVFVKVRVTVLSPCFLIGN